jgi:hypothetical protein
MLASRYITNCNRPHFLPRPSVLTLDEPTVRQQVLAWSNQHLSATESVAIAEIVEALPSFDSTPWNQRSTRG